MRERLARAWRSRPLRADALVGLGYLALAVWLCHGMWPDPATRALADNPADQTLNEWFLAHGVLFWTGEHDLLTQRLNAPDGVNLMSNASLLLPSVVLAPVTALFGAAATFALLLTLNLAGTAIAWYLLFARGLHRHRGAAAVGGLLTGFGPGMISQSNSHLHITAQWLVPAIVWCVLRFTRVTRRRQVLGTAVALAALVVAQLFIGEEVLYLTALTLALFSVAYAALRWRWARHVAPRVIAGLLIAGGTALVPLAYPLWMQVAGPRHVPTGVFAPQFFYADLATYFLYSPLSIFGTAEAGRLASGPTEWNTYLGLPLVALLVGCVIWRRRSPTVLAATFALVVMGWLSLGLTVTVDGQETRWPSLYRLIAELPLIEGGLPTRYALALLPLIAVILVDALHAALAPRSLPTGADNEATAGRLPRLVGTLRARLARTPSDQRVITLATAVVLVTLIPLPLSTVARPTVPGFITSGAWRACVPEGGVLVPVPAAVPGDPEPMRWAAAANAAFALPEGFFLGDYGAGGRASVGTYSQRTSSMLREVAKSGIVPPITDQTRAQAWADLAFWQADCVALAPVEHQDALRATLEQLLGPGTLLVDTWVWRITE